MTAKKGASGITAKKNAGCPVPDTQVALRGKAFATLAARLALVGLQLHRLDDGTLLVTRAVLARQFTNETAAAKFVDGLEVQS